jgi:hypothetical protein
MERVKKVSEVFLNSKVDDDDDDDDNNFQKALTVLRGPLAYPNGLLDLHIETFW